MKIRINEVERKRLYESIRIIRGAKPTMPYTELFVAAKNAAGINPEFGQSESAMFNNIKAAIANQTKVKAPPAKTARLKVVQKNGTHPTSVEQQDPMARIKQGRSMILGGIKSLEEERETLTHQLAQIDTLINEYKHFGEAPVRFQQPAAEPIV